MLHSKYTAWRAVLSKIGPWKSIKDPFPAVTMYLQTAHKEREAWKRYRHNRHAAEIADYCMRYLVLFNEAQTEDRVAKVITWQRSRALALALLGAGCPERTKRHHEIAKQMAARSIETLGEMIGRTHYEIVSRRLDEMKREIQGVTFPEEKSPTPLPNPGYRRMREQIAHDQET